ncbi:MAG: SDR family NAD(P)-dependent oxidoreductase [Deltaproteobacteria bacterium]|nr:SDR family NAD(P)-dependent oxidoreductase [Deltaproteobacteria bacterium]
MGLPRRGFPYTADVVSNLVFITGGSSGIGAAMARVVPYSDPRVINISRRELEGYDHYEADLADPAAWGGVADLFAREIEGFAGERVVFVHSAGTLQPIGFAGEVPTDAYVQQVLLDSASPQVLGDAFLRAARKTRAECHVVMITSGAAFTVFEGWSAYCAGKAAMDQWVRTTGAEQARRGGRCRLLAVAPGIVETPMQREIRAASSDELPSVEVFVDIHAKDQCRDPEEAAREIWSLLDRDLENGAVVDLYVPAD